MERVNQVLAHLVEFKVGHVHPSQVADDPYD